MASVAGKNCRVRVAGTPTAMTDEACATTDDQTYTVVDTAKRVWSPTGTIVVEEGGVAVNPVSDPYTLDRLRGRVVFDSVDALRGAITVTGDYVPTVVAAKARAFTWSLTRTMIDDTGFDDEGWISRVAGLLDASGTLGRRLQTSDPYYQNALLNATLLVLEFCLTGTASDEPDMVAWAIIPKSSIVAAVEGIAEEDVEWQGTPDADERVASVLVEGTPSV